MDKDEESILDPNKVEGRLLGSVLRERTKMPSSSQTVTHLHLLEDHQFIQVLQREFQASNVSGSLVMSLDLVSPYRLEVLIALEVDEGDAMLRSLDLDQVESEIF